MQGVWSTQENYSRNFSFLADWIEKLDGEGDRQIDRERKRQRKREREREESTIPNQLPYEPAKHPNPLPSDPVVPGQPGLSNGDRQPPGHILVKLLQIKLIS